MSWFDAKVVARREVAATVEVELEVAAQVQQSFVAPGQYLKVKLGPMEGPFAVASAPASRGPLRLLFKPGTPITNGLAALRVGAMLSVSLAMGAGFPLHAAKGRPLLLVASGTGQAPMRSVIEAVRAARSEYGAVTFLLGVRDSEHLAFAAEQEAWQNEGINLHITLSQSEPGWRGRKGRVQLHLPDGPLETAVAFIVGQRAMVDEVVAELLKRGLPREQVFLNI